MRPLIISPNRHKRSPFATMWADDYLVLVLSAPMVLTFLPHGGAPLVHDGFDALGRAPDWYIKSVAALMAYAFGRRTIRAIRTAVPTITLGAPKQAPSASPAVAPAAG